PLFLSLSTETLPDFSSGNALTCTYQALPDSSTAFDSWTAFDFSRGAFSSALNDTGVEASRPLALTSFLSDLTAFSGCFGSLLFFSSEDPLLDELASVS